MLFQIHVLFLANGRKIGNFLRLLSSAQSNSVKEAHIGVRYSGFVYFIQATREIDGTEQNMESAFTYKSYLGVPGTLIKFWVWLFKQVVHVLGSHERFPQKP